MGKREEMMNKDVLLRVENIKKHFTGTYALKGVTVELEKGEIHALVGENGAGKSTLMNIISGVLQPDEGTIFAEGEEVSIRNPNEAQNAGIGFVHQELALCQDLTVANNIFIGHLPTIGGMIDNTLLNKKSKIILNRFGESGKAIDPMTIVSDLSVAQQQMVEIAKALARDCRVLIFDEPTSSLNEEEAGGLFKVIHELAESGIGIFYISHKMEEIFSHCNVITILRDGTLIRTVNVCDTDTESVVALMVGKEVTQLYPQKGTERGKEVLHVKSISDRHRFCNISFKTYENEILGLCGLVGAGRSEIARAVCGINKFESGQIFLDEKEVEIHNCKSAMNSGIFYLTEDRKKDGLFLEMTLLENMIAPQIKKFSSHGFISQKKALNTIDEYKQVLNIKYANVNQKIGSLSGGNQQKLMMAKIMAMNPRVVFLDEPTRGIDVGAKVEIHQLLRNLCNEGVGVVVISSEMPETVGICDRVVVINSGELVGEISGAELNQSNIVSAISEFSEKNKKGETA